MSAALGNPFPGLRPFRPDECSLFFGRDEQIGEALDRLMQRKLLAVVGMSGCGKSSLVKAGMIPALEMGLAGDPRCKWRIEIMRPGDGPLRELERCLGLGPLADRTYALRDAVQNRLGADQSLLLVVDQFEEVFAYRDQTRGVGGNEADLFVNYLLSATQVSDGQIFVILTMRSDYLGECARFHDLPEALNDGQYLVPRMTRTQLQDAIEGPLEAVGSEDLEIRFHPSLVQTLLNECDDEPDNLPLLQHLLRRLFEEWQEAGAEGVIEPSMANAAGTLDGALNQDAEDVYLHLSPEQQRAAELLFRRITESRQAERADDDRPIRCPQTVAHLTELTDVSQDELRSMIRSFAERELLVLRPVHPGGPSDPDDRVDLPHECLCRKWLRLKAWVEAETESAKLLRFLADTVGKTHLTGVALEEAWRWHESGRLDGTWCERYLNAAQRTALKDWVRESRRLFVEERQRLREQEKQERDAALDRRLRWVFGFIALAFALVGGWAWDQATTAKANEQEAHRKAKLASDRSESVLEYARVQADLQAVTSQTQGLGFILNDDKSLSDKERAGIQREIDSLLSQQKRLRATLDRASANVLLVAASGSLRPEDAIRRDDLFDVRQGTEVTAFSGSDGDHGDSGPYMFGAKSGDPALGMKGRGSGPPEQVVTFFEDGKPTDFQHTIEWHTKRPVIIRSVGLFARHDEEINGFRYRRAFSKFTLFAKVENNEWIVVAEFRPKLPYGQGEHKNLLAVCLDAKPETSREFRAEFVQAVDILGQHSAPRVVALDGFDRQECSKSSSDK